jgi:hypothetical protein
MKASYVALALALPAVAGCGQPVNQNVPASPYAGTQARSSVVGRVQPATCGVPWVGGPPSTVFVRWPWCSGYAGRMYFGTGTTPGIRLVSTDYTTNPGGVPVPPGETPVLFEQMTIDAPAGLVTFTPPVPFPVSRIQGVANGQTYQLYAYISGVPVTPGFPIALGMPSPPGIVRFTAPPYSPLPLLPALPSGTTVSFELVTP